MISSSLVKSSHRHVKMVATSFTCMSVSFVAPDHRHSPADTPMREGLEAQNKSPNTVRKPKSVIQCDTVRPIH